MLNEAQEQLYAYFIPHTIQANAGIIHLNKPLLPSKSFPNH
jgi:hypothetical protein